MNKLIRAAAPAALLTLVLQTPALAEPLKYQYEYTGDTNLSGMTAGSLQLGKFTDSTDGPADAIVVDGTRHEIPGGLTGILKQAFGNALREAEAPMTDSDGIVFSADVVEFETQETAEGLQLMLRARIAVDRPNGGGNLWENVLFSRVTAESGELPDALDAALDRLTRELFWDNYFTMALGIF